MEISNQAYQMYMQGIKHKDIGYALGLTEQDSRHLVRNYAIKNKLEYPRPKANLGLCYSLYVNGMSVRDIARFKGVSENTIKLRIKKHCAEKGITPPTSHNRGKVAFELREKYGFSYSKIAKMVGYQNRSNCYRAIKKYKESIC